MAEGFIKIHRDILDWEWYKDSATLKLFVHCLLLANWQDGRFRGTDVPRGSFVTSIQHLADGAGLSPMQTRTALKRLEDTGEIVKKSTNKFTVITVRKYRDFQDFSVTSNKQTTNKQQTNNKQITTIEERKNKRKKETYKPSQATNASERTYTDEQLNGLYKNMEDEQ